jgi:Flp pilus assembly protein TadD
MSAGKLAAALEVFKLNTLISPESSNAWDSLAECYLNMEEYDLARKYYEQSLELNPANSNATMMLKRIPADAPADPH